jgi:hypothetical protein
MMLNFSKYTLYIVGCFLLVGCGESEAEKERTIAYDASIIAPLVDAKMLATTEIVPTLEHPLTAGKNAIYTPTLLYAWDEVRKKCNFPNEIAGENSESFKLFNRSESFKNVLDTSEYNTSVDVQESMNHRRLITAKAFFKKELGFMGDFNRKEPMKFGEEKVACFGSYHLDWHDMFILCYEDDDNFVIEMPTGGEDHIIITKGAPTNTTFAETILFVENKIKKAKSDKNQANTWRYGLNKEDYFLMPFLKFNISNNDSNIEEQSFTYKDWDYKIIKAYQENALTWSETGAIIRSYAQVEQLGAPACIKVSTPEPVVKPHPKHFIFNKPFYIFFRKKAQKNPYFAFKIEDTAFMNVAK